MGRRNGSRSQRINNNARRVGLWRRNRGVVEGLTKNEQSRTWKIPGSHAKSLKSHKHTHVRTHARTDSHTRTRTHARMHTYSQPALRNDNSGEFSDKSNQPESFAMVMQNQNCSNCIQSTAELKKKKKKKTASLNGGNRNFTWLRSFSTHFPLLFNLGIF